MVWTEPGLEVFAEQFVRLRLAQTPEATMLNFFDDDPTYDIGPLLARVQAPTLVTHGTADRASPIADGHYLAVHIPNARFYPFRDRGHVPIFTATTEFCAVLRQFVHTGTAPEPRQTS